MTAHCNERPQPSLLNPTGDRIGELLSRFVPLSRHDIYEVLEEQTITHKKFGQIALHLGLCEPVHLWQAWSAQLIGRTPRVTLSRFGVDAQATSDVPAWLASALGVVPIRSTENRLVIAASDQTLARATEVLTAESIKPISFVLADQEEVERAIARYYTLIPTTSADTAHGGCASKRCGEKCLGDECPARKKLAARKLAAVLV